MKLLQAAKKDEKAAPGQYAKLLKTLTSPKDKKIVTRIISDEKRHLRLLKTIKLNQIKNK